ncbi:hypothetical protein J1N35_004806 [Gossypium stocksii]|uniref:Uncharacterized protein n=1 Tax=Gossypium stocksii TaxID=47602 RepID=A0A9D3WCP0_9ROSI|nr:hypothetical protein J1N35_004806 [Gossypium stocksii]
MVLSMCTYSICWSPFQPNGFRISWCVVLSTTLSNPFMVPSLSWNSPLMFLPTTSSSPLADNDAQAFVATLGVIGNNAWYPNSGATQHLTNNVASLTSSVPYIGSGEVFVGNGSALSITRVGQLSLFTDIQCRGSRKFDHMEKV